MSAHLTAEERRAIVTREYRAVLAGMTPSMDRRFSGQQIAYAVGAARKRALVIIDQADREALDRQVVDDGG